MNKKILYFSVIGILIIAGTTPNTFAFDLPMEFDRPCLGGMGILEAICDTVNVLHDFAHEQETRINTLNATQILQQIQIDSLNAIQILEIAEQDIIQSDIIALNDTNNILIAQIAVLEGETKFSNNGEFTIPGITISPTRERGVSIGINSFLPIIVDFEFTSLQNHILFTNGTLIDIPGPHLLPSFVNSVDVFFKERLSNGTTVNHPLCSITAGDSISDCNLIGFNTTVVPQRPTVNFFVDSNAPTDTFRVFDIEGIFSITTRLQ